jgi:hypothetical protein
VNEPEIEATRTRRWTRRLWAAGTGLVAVVAIGGGAWMLMPTHHGTATTPAVCLLTASDADGDTVRLTKVESTATYGTLTRRWHPVQFDPSAPVTLDLTMTLERGPQWRERPAARLVLVAMDGQRHPLGVLPLAIPTELATSVGPVQSTAHVTSADLPLTPSGWWMLSLQNDPSGPEADGPGCGAAITLTD